jgi:hypothetical protein
LDLLKVFKNPGTNVISDIVCQKQEIMLLQKKSECITTFACKKKKTLIWLPIGYGLEEILYDLNKELNERIYKVFSRMHPDL